MSVSRPLWHNASPTMVFKVVLFTRWSLLHKSVKGDPFVLLADHVVDKTDVDIFQVSQLASSMVSIKDTTIAT